MKNWYLIMSNLIRNKSSFGSQGPQLNILNDWLYINNQAVQKVDCSVEKYDQDKKNNVQYIIHHYTASTTAKSAHDSYTNEPTRQDSWHLTIDRDGNVYQLLGFDKVAWHAGESAVGNLKYLNPISIGIEHVNAGPLRQLNGSWTTWSGQKIADQDVFFDANGNAWMNYTQEQATASYYVTLFLANYFKVRDILPHSAICIPQGRKQDTGPAWDNTLGIIRKAYLGR